MTSPYRSKANEDAQLKIEKKPEVWTYTDSWKNTWQENKSLSYDSIHIIEYFAFAAPNKKYSHSNITLSLKPGQDWRLEFYRQELAVDAVIAISRRAKLVVDTMTKHGELPPTDLDG